MAAESVSSGASNSLAQIRKISKKNLVIFIGSFVGVIAIIAAVAIIPRAIEDATAAENLRLGAEDLTEAFSETILKEYEPDCSAVDTATTGNINYELANSITNLSSGVTDSRTAAGLVSANGIITTSFESELIIGFEDFVSSSFSKIMSNEERAKNVKDSQRDKWAGQWQSYVLDKCDLTTKYQENLSVLESADSSSEQLVALAATAPWYPEGWYVSPTDDNVAWMWQDPSSLSCVRCSIWAITILPKQSCSSVYAEISISQGGTAVDWTNSTLGAISSGQQGVMEFTSYPYRPNSEGRITEINCW
jgi:hypothetical protein